MARSPSPPDHLAPTPLRLVRLPVHTVSEPNARPGHWAQLRSKKGRTTLNRGFTARVFDVELRREPSLLPLPHPLVVLLVRESPGHLDVDNLGTCLKAVRDGIADALRIDDGDERLTFVVDQVRAKQHGVRVELYERASFASVRLGAGAITLLPTGALARVDTRLRALDELLARAPVSTGGPLRQQFAELRKVLVELGLH